MTETDDQPAIALDLLALARSGSSGRPVWSFGSDDLNVNPVVLRSKDSVAEHTCAKVDVLVLGMDGKGIVEVDGRALVVASGEITVIPKGHSRAIRAGAAGFAYLTCHCQWRGL